MNQPDRPCYTLPASAIEEAQARISKANRRLARAGITERFTFETTAPYVISDPNGKTRFVCDLTLSHPSLSYDGWTFSAAVDHLETGAIVRSKPGVELNGWRPEISECQHCGRTRRRAATYLVTHDDGTRKQIGSTCMTAFLGVKVTGLWAIGFDPLEEVDEDTWLSGPTWDADTAAEVIDVIAVALAVTESGRRYRSRDWAAARGCASTSEEVSAHLNGPHWRMTAEERAVYAQVAVDAEAFKVDGTAQTVLSYARELTGSTDYANNVRTLAYGEHVGPRHVGLLASVVSSWARDKDRQALNEARAAAYTPGFLAEPGSTVAGVKAVVELALEIDNPFSYYGDPNTLIIMRADTGHTLKWAATGRHEVKAGDRLELTGGKVKAHSTYNGQDQTVITRVKYNITSA